MKKIFIFCFCLYLVFLFCHPVFAREEKLELIAEGQYFSIYGHKGLDIYSVLQNLNFSHISQLDTLLTNGTDDPAELLGKTLDAIYLEVSDAMDIHIYSFHGTIKLMTDRYEVSKAFKEIYGRQFPERAVYIHSRNTIYLSAKDITLGMLGHEMAHAIMSHYFVVPPSGKIQEILAGYVEYNLRKAAGTLP